MSEAGPPLPTMPQPGTLLDGKYRLVRQLGAGGMGLVFEADHIRLRQPFAVKVLQPQLAQHREFLGRFEREARAAALLRSPHVVRVFDVDVSNDGLTYIVMELLEGRDLAEEATAGPVAVKDLADWMIQSCSALEEAHAQGIVHRDLKPANIFLAKIESGERIAKVVDFGISKVEATSTNVLSVRDGTALGTPTFMSPEQIRGRRVDGRADLWALGVIMYRILGGRWPFNGKTDQEYMSAVLADPPIPFELVRADLPYELASVIMRALEKDPASRFPSANAMAAALAPFGSGRSPLVATTSLPPPAARGSSMHPSAEPAASRAVVVPASGGETRSDRAAYLDTVIDRPMAHGMHPIDKTAPLGVSQPSPAGPVFVPPTPAYQGSAQGVQAQTPAAVASSKSSGAFVAVAAVAAVAIGFAGYMFATRSEAKPSPASGPSSVASEPSASSAAPPASTTLDPAIASAQPAPTGVTSAPSASGARRRHRTGAPHPSNAPAPDTAETAAPPPAIPDHL